MSDLLRAIVASARRSAEGREQAGTRAAVEREAADRQPRGDDFVASLCEPGIRVIAECKWRSPSRGPLRRTYDPAAIGRAYEAAGAAAVSVLTEAAFFDGSLDHLRAVRAATTLPLLRKDFIVGEFQLVEARAAGADAALLIVAALDDPTLKRLVGVAASLGLAALVEVHDRDELGRAVQAGASTIGVNSRDLRTLDVRPVVLDELVAEIPAGAVAVAESGLRTPEDLRRLQAAGYDAFLIGERLMTQERPGAALDELRTAAAVRHEAVR